MFFFFLRVLSVIGFTTLAAGHLPHNVVFSFLLLHPQSDHMMHVDPTQTLREFDEARRRLYVPVPKPPLDDATVDSVRKFSAIIADLNGEYDTDAFQLTTLAEFHARPKWTDRQPLMEQRTALLTAAIQKSRQAHHVHRNKSPDTCDTANELSSDSHESASRSIDPKTTGDRQSPILAVSTDSARDNEEHEEAPALPQNTADSSPETDTSSGTDTSPDTDTPNAVETSTAQSDATHWDVNGGPNGRRVEIAAKLQPLIATVKDLEGYVLS